MSDSAKPSNQMEHRLTGLRFPRHILNADGEPYCGIELNDQHKRLLERADPEDLGTVGGHHKEYGALAISNFCGNCLRVYLNHNDDPELEAARDEWQSRTEGL